MNRREFLSVSVTAGTAALAPGVSAAETRRPRQFFELRRYVFGGGEGDPSEVIAAQRRGFDAFMREAAIPALNRMELRPIGVFYPQATEKQDAAYVVIPHPSLQRVALLTQRLRNDPEFVKAGAAFLDAPRERPAYRRIESTLLQAFSAMPTLETPVTVAGRVLQLRVYESPSEKTNLKKIEMFEEGGELQIFREVGLAPVFFGRAIIGERIPNLTYMLAFESEEKLKENWRKFGAHSDWVKLKAMPEYADKTILSGITNILLRPADYSQV
jgi:hypothetical protein